jgi:uncharacterized protein (DUF58 family)
MDPQGARYRSFLIFVTPLLGALGIATRATALAALAAGLGLLLARAFLDSRRRLLGLRLHRHMHPNAFEDDAVRVELVLENRSRRPALLLDLEDTFSASVALGQHLLEPGPLPPQRRVRLAYRSFCSRGWGEHRIGPLELRVSDALGLFRARRLFFELDTLTVFPRAHEVAGLERLGARPSLSPQAVTLARPGESLAYLGVRDYRPGDDARRIHWPATARTGELAVKEYEVDLIPYFTLFLDLNRGARAGTGRKSTLEYVARTAVSMVWTASQRGDVVQVIGDGGHPLYVPPGTGELHATQALYELVRIRQEGRIPLLDLVEQHRTLLPAGSTAGLLFASLDVDPASLDSALEALRASRVRALVFIVNDASFVAIDRWRLERPALEERLLSLRALLRERAVPGAILHAEGDLAQDLSRADLYDDRVA